MELKTMWLDRLPLKKDVVSHYFYALQDLRNNGIPIRDNYLLSLTANVVKYIWLEIDVPTIDLPSIIKQLQNILVQFEKWVKSNISKDTSLRKHLCEKSDSLNIAQDVTMTQYIIDNLTELFDISETQSSNEFFLEQKSSRKLRIETRLGQRSMVDEDVYYTKMVVGNVYLTHILSGLPEQHYAFLPSQLPTLLDVLRFICSRIMYRKVYRSVGDGSMYSTNYHDVLRSCCRIWEERGLLFPGDMRRRFQEIYERDRKKFHRGELPSIYRDGLALSSHKKKAPSVERLTDVEAYCQFHLDQLDREVMDLFPFSSASIRKKIIDGNPTINKSSSSVVEETEVGHFTLTGIDLTIPDFESYISGDKIDPNKWQISVDASDEVTLEEDMDHEMNNAYDDPDDFITEKNSSDAFTQTFMTCPIDYSFNWPFNVDM